MRLAPDAIAIGDEPEFAVHGVDVAVRDAHHERFGPAAVLNEIGNRADLQAMLRSEFDEIRQPRHFPVLLQDLADHRGRREPGKAREIAPRFSVSGANEHPALLRHQREDVAGLHDILRARVRADRGAYRARAVGSGDAGGHALRGLDRHGEVRAERRAVVADHQREIKLSAALFREREADQAAAVTRHEVDRLGRRKLGTDQEIAFVLAVLFIDQHHHAAGFEVVDDLGDRADGGLVAGAVHTT